ncbi:hypothetical protein TRVL_09631 [Trypanosoma vivax]|uniref:Uncharacterized protein n=1 Tax=Trypanosoma vivax (strain Y486) TaxID=1055687 RepID=G0UD45_TRYVY|nr:hypothetical protein TRVL_09631 [Trypanosoma vivax]CCC53755.1 hypothetical protein TVY486_1112390 [Trypanosoma vivax Y486]
MPILKISGVYPLQFPPEYFTVSTFISARLSTTASPPHRAPVPHKGRLVSSPVLFLVRVTSRSDVWQTPDLALRLAYLVPHTSTFPLPLCGSRREDHKQQ